jgi:flagellar basal body-associated protein FliL
VKKKLKFILPLVVLILLGGVYKVVLAKPPKKVKEKVDGQVYVLPKEFLLNLADGHFAKLDVALVLDKTQAVAPAAGGEAAVKPPDGYGALEQEAVVRAIITNDLTDAQQDDLTGRKGRVKLQHTVLKDLKAHTDVKVNDVLFTDVAVQ